MFSVLKIFLPSHNLADAKRNLLRVRIACLLGLICAQLLIFPLSGYGQSIGLPLNQAPTYITVDDQLSSLIFGLFIGVMLTASAYLFFIWIVMRDRGQVFLLFLLICLAANIASTDDLLMNQLGLHNNATRTLLSNYSMIFSSIFGVIFTYYFLEIDTHNSGFRIPLFMLAIMLLLLLMYSIIDQTLAHFALPTVNTLTISVVLAAGMVSLRQGISGSFTHITAFLFFLAGALAEPLYDLGFITNPQGANNLTYISFSMSALMFAIVIASQFAARQDEKERALATSNERFTLATRGANEGLFDWNIQNGEVFFSDQFRRILGLRLDNVAQSLKVWMRLMLLSDRRIVREALRRFRHNPDINTVNVEYRIVHANNTRRWLHTKAVAVRDMQSKKIIRVVGSISDITARKQSEVALRSSEARFRSITEAHPVPVLIVSLRNGIILYASPGAEDLFGINQNQLINEYFERFLVDTNVRLEIIQAMEDRSEVNLKEIRLSRISGKMLDAAVSARRISYQNEDAMALGLYDLTDQKKAEAQIARQQEALQQSEKMAALGGLLAGVAHELNNPLSVVVGQATLLMEGSPEPKVITRAEKIYKAADRCSRIVKSFLALARRKPPEHRQVNLNDIISNALELLGYQIRTSDIEIILDLEKELPTIIGDADQLAQVITNLVLNATQAMQGWKSTRRITINSSHSNDGKVILRVIDTGPGIPADIRSRVFEPFFTTKSTQGGTGVGLALCLNIVSSHDGTLVLDETPGGGASFTITIPMAHKDNQQGSEQIEEAITLPPNLRILIVDDELELAQTLADLLEPDSA